MSQAAGRRDKEKERGDDDDDDDERRNYPSIFFFRRQRERGSAFFVFFVLVFKGSKNDSSGTLKEAFRLPGGNVIPARISRVTQGGMRGIKGGLGVEEARQSP